MHVINTNFSSLGELHKNLDLSNLNPEKTLVQIFSGLVSYFEIKQIQSILKEKNSEILYIGSTTAGEICEAEVKENSITISIMEFEDTTFNLDFFTDENDYNLGIKIAETLFTSNTKAMILFIDGLQTKGNEVLNGISSVNNSIPLAGGIAGDNGNFLETFVFDKNGIYSKGCIAVTLNSDILNVYTDYQLNWQPIGQMMTVTKAEKNRLYEIDGISASEIYRKYLGDKVGDNLPFSATEFPLLKIDDDGLEICRIFKHQFEEDGSLLTMGDIEVGDKVRLAFGNVDLVLNSTIDNLHQYQSFAPEAIFTYSCTARLAFLQSEITVELEPLNRIAPTCGFFTYGEIFHNNNKNELLNVSLTILALSENNVEYKNNFDIDNKNGAEKNFITNKHFLVLEALTHLSNTVIKELEETQEQLKSQANKDYLTNLYNRRYFNEVAEDIIQLSKRENKPCSIIMLDIDKFKDINDTYGHTIGDKFIEKLANILLLNTRESDIVSRFGGDEFAILLPFTNKQEAYKVSEDLRINVEKQNITIDDKIIKFTISLGIDVIDYNENNCVNMALDKADKALYEAKETGRNKSIMKN